MGDLIRNISDLPVRDRVTVTETGMQITGNVTYDEWLNLLAGLQRIGGAWKWAVGDGLNYGEAKYGETYAQATVFAEQVGLNPETVQKLMRVAQNVPQRVRRASLSHGHHDAVMGIDPEWQDALLCQADRDRWTVAEIRRHKNEVKRRLEAGLPVGLTGDPNMVFAPIPSEEEEPGDTQEVRRRRRSGEGERAADPPPEHTTQTRTGPVEEAPEEEDVYGEVDMLAELEAAHARAERAEEIVRELARDDDAQAVIEWRDKYHRLRGRLQDVQRSYHEERKAREWQTDLLQKIRAFLGVERSSQIMDALKRRGSG